MTSDNQLHLFTVIISTFTLGLWFLFGWLLGLPYAWWRTAIASILFLCGALFTVISWAAISEVRETHNG